MRGLCLWLDVQAVDLVAYGYALCLICGLLVGLIRFIGRDDILLQCCVGWKPGWDRERHFRKRDRARLARRRGADDVLRAVMGGLPEEGVDLTLGGSVDPAKLECSQLPLSDPLQYGVLMNLEYLGDLLRSVEFFIHGLLAYHTICQLLYTFLHFRLFYSIYLYSFTLYSILRCLFCDSGNLNFNLTVFNLI